MPSQFPQDQDGIISDVSKQQSRTLLTNPRLALSCIIIHRNDWIIAGSDHHSGTLFVWETQASSGQKPCRILEGHKACITDLIDLDDCFASSSKDGTIRLWKDFKCIRVLKNGHGLNCYPTSLAFTNEENGTSFLVSGGTDRLIVFWDIESGQPGHRLGGHQGWITRLMTHHSNLISGSTDTSIRIWDLNTMETMFILEGHQDWIFCFAILSDDELVSGSRDGSLKVWDLDQGLCIKTLSSETSTDIRSLAIVTMGDQPLVLSMGNDNLIHKWDPLNWHQIGTLKGHFGSIRGSVVLSKTHLLTASRDGTVRRWAFPDDFSKDCQKEDMHPGILVESVSAHSRPSSRLPTLAEWDEAQRVIEKEENSKFKLQKELASTQAELDNLKAKISEKSMSERDLEVLLKDSENRVQFWREHAQTLSNHLEAVLDLAIRRAEEQLRFSQSSLDDFNDFMGSMDPSELEEISSHELSSGIEYQSLRDHGIEDPSESRGVLHHVETLFEHDDSDDLECPDIPLASPSVTSPSRGSIGISSPRSIPASPYKYQPSSPSSPSPVASLEKMAWAFERSIEKAMDRPWSFVPRWMKSEDYS